MLHWSSLFPKDCTLWKGPTLDKFIKNYSLWEGLMMRSLCRTVSREWDPVLEQGKRVSRKEQQ